MTEQQIRDEIRRLAPFHHNVALPYGLRTYVPELSRRPIEATRFPHLARRLFSALRRLPGGLHGKRVLDVGCNCGGFSVESARLGAAYVLGIDVVDRYLKQAEFLKGALDLPALEFRRLPVEEVAEASTGRFDITLCLGLLYHLESPVAAMRALASVTDELLVVDTALLRTPLARRPLWLMNFPRAREGGDRPPATSLWRTAAVCQFLPNARAVVDLLRFVGFPHVAVLSRWSAWPDRRYVLGHRATFLAARDPRLGNAGFRLR
jgi:tRNA (mo5U34)-methyltransferase